MEPQEEGKPMERAELVLRRSRRIAPPRPFGLWPHGKVDIFTGRLPQGAEGGGNIDANNIVLYKIHIHSSSFMQNEQVPGRTEPLPIVGGFDRKKKCGDGLGVPLNDPRFWPKGQTPAQQLRETLRMPVEGEGEG